MSDERPWGDALVPPHNMLAEQSAVGGMLLSVEAAHDVLQECQARDFYDPRHEIVYEAVAELLAGEEPTDVIAVTDALTKSGMLQRAGGADYLHTLTGVPPTSANAGYYASIVREKALMRRLVEAGTRIVQMGYASEGEPAALVENARAEVDSVSTTFRSEIAQIGDSFSALVEELEAPPTHVETPWPEINQLIGGLRPGRLYVVGARPGEGKSIMGLQIAGRMAQHGPVAFSSLEMSREELLTRMISMRGKIHMTPLSQHRLDENQWDRVAMHRTEIMRMPLFVDDRSEINITQIRAFARDVARKAQPSCVLVDYLQLIGGDSRKERHVVVGEISRGLKIMAKQLGCPVVALSQLNRESVGKTRRAPTLGDLRESGAIEQDADVVLLLQRQLDEDDKPGDRLNVYVAKNRHGQIGMRSLIFEGQYSRLTSPGWGRPPELPIRED